MVKIKQLNYFGGIQLFLALPVFKPRTFFINYARLSIVFYSWSAFAIHTVVRVFGNCNWEKLHHENSYVCKVSGGVRHVFYESYFLGTS